MTAQPLSRLDLQIRLAVYDYIVEHTEAPAPATLAAQLGLATSRATSHTMPCRGVRRPQASAPEPQ